MGEAHSRRDVHPDLLTSLIGNGAVLQPIAMLPLMDCENCLFRSESWRDGGFCYMFREKPRETHCGQFSRITTEKAEK